MSQTDDQGEQGLGARADPVLNSIRIGGFLVGCAVTIGFFTKEVQRILALPPLLKNDFYLVLLLLTFLLIGSWFLCALMHVEQMKKWADAPNYYPPEEVVRVVAFAVVFIVLIYSARAPLAFGISYAIYSFMNLFTMRHLRIETADVLAKARAGLERHPVSGQIRSDALSALEDYCRKLLSSRRAWWTVAGAVCGLAAAVIGAVTKSAPAVVAAYSIFIVSVGVPELLLSWLWRGELARRLRPCEAALFEINRKSEGLSAP
jgi:hypothetical protein